MTLPMSIDEKKKARIYLMNKTGDLEMLIRAARIHLGLSEPPAFDGQHVVIAKNCVLEASDICLSLEHSLHELIDAPII